MAEPHKSGPKYRQSGDDGPENQPDLDQASPAERIFQVVALIPKGRVATYGQVARLAGLPRHARLVGRTLSNLPARTRLPWHRVINASMRISRREAGGDIEQLKRLQKEGISFVGTRVPRQFAWDA